jgi:hypothetical protein
MEGEDGERMMRGYTRPVWKAVEETRTFLGAAKEVGLHPWMVQGSTRTVRMEGGRGRDEGGNGLEAAATFRGL